MIKLTMCHGMCYYLWSREPTTWTTFMSEVLWSTDLKKKEGSQIEYEVILRTIDDVCVHVTHACLCV